MRFPKWFPAAQAPGVRKLEIMADMWRKYLSSEEKSKYLKFAVGIVGIGAAEGVTPVLIQKIMDSQTLIYRRFVRGGLLLFIGGLGMV